MFIVDDGEWLGTLNVNAHFALLKRAFFFGIELQSLAEEMIICEVFVSEGGDLAACESYADVINGISEIYMRDTSKEHLRKYLQQRLLDDLEI